MRTKIRLAAVLVAALAIAGCKGGTSTPKSPPPEHVDNVAVLVVDDFQLKPNLPQDDPAANCAHSGLGTNSKGANEVGGTGAGDGLPPEVSHGEAVFTELKSELETLFRPVGSTVQPVNLATYGLASAQAHTDTGVTDKFLARWQYQKKDILLLGVDTNHFTTGVINEHLKSLLSTISGGSSKVQFRRVVVNMSFVIAPCNVKLWLERNGDNPNSQAWFDSYRAAVYAEPDLEKLKATINKYAGDLDPLHSVQSDTKFDQVGQRLNIEVFYRSFIKDPSAANLEAVDIAEAAKDASEQQPKTLAGKAYMQISHDPLNDKTAGFANATKGVTTVAVGAAGNGIVLPDPDRTSGRHFRFPFPFAPALWSDVLSMSASTPDGKKRTDYSNSGEVMLPGNFDLRVSDPSASPNPKVYKLEGTSFAAPRMSAKQAIYLLTGGDVPCDGDIPPLGYAGEGFSFAHGRVSWGNIAYDLATADCTFFTTRLILHNP